MKTSLGIDPATGAEKFEITDENGVIVGYDLVFASEE